MQVGHILGGVLFLEVFARPPVHTKEISMAEDQNDVKNEGQKPPVPQAPKQQVAPEAPVVEQATVGSQPVPETTEVPEELHEYREVAPNVQARVRTDEEKANDAELQRREEALSNR